MEERRGNEIARRTIVLLSAARRRKVVSEPLKALAVYASYRQENSPDVNLIFLQHSPTTGQCLPLFMIFASIHDS